MSAASAMHRARARLSVARRVVVKVGSQLLTLPTGLPNLGRVSALAAQVAAMKAAGREVLLVSSGAVAFGRRALGWSGPPRNIAESQMLASVGQALLIEAHRSALAGHDLVAGQVLLTHHDIGNRAAYLNAHNTLRLMLQHGVVPVLNENDATGYEELRFGDNDHLAALVAVMIEADLLVLLTVPDGVFEADPLRDPGAPRISFVASGGGAPVADTSSGGTEHGKGGMASKVEAARVATRAGVTAVVAAGTEEDCLDRILGGGEAGTLFEPSAEAMLKRRHWVRYGLRPAGSILLDDGAADAVRERGASVLPVGIVEVRGSFSRGEAVEILDPQGGRLGQGLAAYPADELRRLQGRHSAEIHEILGYRYLDVAVHRDDLIVG